MTTLQMAMLWQETHTKIQQLQTNLPHQLPTLKITNFFVTNVTNLSNIASHYNITSKVFILIRKILLVIFVDVVSRECSVLGSIPPECTEMDLSHLPILARNVAEISLQLVLINYICENSIQSSLQKTISILSENLCKKKLVHLRT